MSEGFEDARRTPPDRPCAFTDGSVHPVYADADGRQFVLGGEVLVYGTWVRPDGADEPMIVGR